MHGSVPDVPAPPVHVAIIMDGNGRWAKARSLPRTAGHRKGVEAVKRTIEAAKDLGIRYVTIFGFSSENWRRPETEVTDLMQLLRFYLRSEIADLHRNRVRLRVIGDRSRLAPDIVTLISNAEGLTSSNTDITLIIALSYGSRFEITEAARCLVRAVAEGRMSVDDLDEHSFSSLLWTADIPDPDLVIRTSGEQRLSNFLLWQSAYAELVFTETLWPDFCRRDLEDAVREFHRRDRRYGAIAGSR